MKKPSAAAKRKWARQARLHQRVQQGVQGDDDEDAEVDPELAAAQERQQRADKCASPSRMHIHWR